ncbi:hypothetical protein [Novipirellula artificiosorum]|uniref:TIGR03067 domain-containing protein n=1 Tax=Novipirellula artificiosorum TaxID=2528016 RepID=A0A5C6DZ49_9BACT|nr:hypothetical protein [Novipirellula artificiosorum]TWU41725.1 hypothetical protein Poly41_00170 [Novipirellula artificiosorum]
MSRPFLLLLAGLILVLCEPAIGKDPSAKNKETSAKKTTGDAKRLQGTWMADLEPGLQGRLVLDGSTLLYVHINDRRETVIWDGHFAVNEQTTPKQMDWTPLRRREKSPQASLAIYRLEGDLLLLIGSTESERPVAFYSGGGDTRPKTVIFHRAQANSKQRLTSEGRSKKRSAE